MNNEEIISKINTFLHLSATKVSSWLQGILPNIGDDWWQNCVLDQLTDAQYEMANRKGFNALSDFDLAALLRIATKNWYTLRNYVYLPNWQRDTFFDMMRVRNNWAHVGASLPGKDEILADLETIAGFLSLRGCDRDVIAEINDMIQDVKNESPLPVSSNQHKEAEEMPMPTAEIKTGDVVFINGNPDQRGYVVGVEKMEDTLKYQVFLDGALQTFYDGQISIVAPQTIDTWGNVSDLICRLSSYQISHPSGRDLYSLNSARIDFVPYQFKPALKIIHSDEPRILIADSVGVGKTIEAGLIIRELSARKELENILIICPKPLVVERKWESEMKRFEEDFVSMDGPTLRETIKSCYRDGGFWPTRYSRAIIPYSILDGRVYESAQGRKKNEYGLLDLDPAPHFDLVIIDEAHHIRNGSIEKQKAYEYKCAKFFCDHADAVVMLTATPLQTSDNDLFTLLNLLRPDFVLDRASFDLMSKPNAYISECLSLIRGGQEGYQSQALAKLRAITETQWGEQIIQNDPVYQSAISTLEKPSLSREERVNLISDIESLHSFNLMINRTRRRDIQDFCVRRPFTISVNFTEAQKNLYNALLQFEKEALLSIHGAPNAIPFMTSMIKRQAASCVFGIAPHMESLVQRRFNAFLDIPEFIDEDGEIQSIDLQSLSILANNLIDLANNLPSEDPKYDALRAILRKKAEQENNKVIVFSTFLFTLSYLYAKLLADGFRVGQIDGSVKDGDRQELRRRFELPKDDPNALDILLFTEVGSEGLDYQFCDTMVNYDLPWNPMRIEQRIGRIDRRGQISEVVSIYNLITEETVDADIYYRCFERIGVFERSIGECDSVLGDITSELTAIGTDSTLTDEERREKLEQIADNEVRKMQMLHKLEDEEQEFFGLNVSEYIVSKEIHDAENPFLSQRALQILVETYLSKRLGEGNYLLGSGPMKSLRIAAEARILLREDYLSLPRQNNLAAQTWDAYLRGSLPTHAITFDSDEARNDGKAIFITAMHPLAKQAAAYFNSDSSLCVSLSYSSDEIQAGEYPFAIYAWNQIGNRPHTSLITVCLDQSVASIVPEAILTSAHEDPAEMPAQKTWEQLETKQIAMWKEARRNAIEEAERSVAHKLTTLTDSFNRKERSLLQKINDATDERIIRMRNSELETARQKYRAKANELNSLKTDILSTLIAKGVIKITN